MDLLLWVLPVLFLQRKSQAMLIRSFMETAAHPAFLHNLYHSSLYRYHVLQHRDLPDPGLPPYYSHDFFAEISDAHLNTPMNVTTMTSRQWYTLLVEKNITMEMAEENSPQQQYIPCRAELTNPTNDWNNPISKLQTL